MLTSNAYHHVFGVQAPPINSPKIKTDAAIEAAQKALTEPESTQDSCKCISTKMLYSVHVDMDYEEGNCVFCVAFSNNAEYLAATTADGIAQVYDHQGRFCWKMDSGDKNC